MKNLLKNLLFILLIVGGSNSYAVLCQSKASGNFNLPDVWNNCNGGIPKDDDDVQINNGHTINLNISTPTIRYLTVNPTGNLVKPINVANANINVSNRFYIQGTVTINGQSNIYMPFGTLIVDNAGKLNFLSHN